MLTLVTAALSNLVSNVPAVLALKPFVAGFHDQQRAWLTIAMASTLAGNLLLTGSLANLIVAERAATVGVRLGFLDHARAGIPITLASMALATIWLWAIGVMGF